MAQQLHKVVDVEPMIAKEGEFEIGLLTCYLENGESFVLYNIPPEIARAISKLRSDDAYFEIREDNRETIYELLIMLSPKLSEIGNSIGMVVIDHFDMSTMTYRASLYIEVDGIRIRKVMIPSHAIFLALLFNRPIYVTDEVLKISKDLEGEEEEEDDGESFIDM